MIYVAQRDDRGRWRIALLIAAGEVRDLCGAVDSSVAEKTASLLNKMRGW